MSRTLAAAARAANPTQPPPPFARSREAETFGALVAGGYHIETYTGAFLDLISPSPANIRLLDIAHGLAHTCRGAGQTRRFFSVAEHAVLVSRRLRELGCPPQKVLAGLHHDDPEAYIHDITKPLKEFLGAYARVERRMWEAISAALDLGHCDIADEAVKDADVWALGAENHHLRLSRGSTWYCAGVYSVESHPLELGLAPCEAETLWLREHYRLQQELAAVGALR